MQNYQDSTGKPIKVGDRVRWRGEVYTIKAFHPGAGRSYLVAAIDFEEPRHSEEVPDEISVDLVREE